MVFVDLKELSGQRVNEANVVCVVQVVNKDHRVNVVSLAQEDCLDQMVQAGEDRKT